MPPAARCGFLIAGAWLDVQHVHPVRGIAHPPSEAGVEERDVVRVVSGQPALGLVPSQHRHPDPRLADHEYRRVPIREPEVPAAPCPAGDLEYVAAELSRQTGRSIPYRNLPVAEYANALVSFGLPPALAEAIAGYDLEASKGALFDDGKVLSRLIGRPTTPLAQVIAAALKAA